ncbi:hypothetical protein BN2364_0475 [Alloalcanivorax xenomutans]|jgi:hypothetical protein|nr:hypothetical protein BN2364_0475 [Alloalcanivorax xenomutans]
MAPGPRKSMGRSHKGNPFTRWEHSINRDIYSSQTAST